MIKVPTGLPYIQAPTVPNHSTGLRLGKEYAFVSRINLKSLSRISEETNCDVRENYNSGCGVKMTKPFNYGPDFNSQGGGW